MQTPYSILDSILEEKYPNSAFSSNEKNDALNALMRYAFDTYKIPAWGPKVGICETLYKKALAYFCCQAAQENNKPTNYFEDWDPWMIDILNEDKENEEEKIQNEPQETPIPPWSFEYQRTRFYFSLINAILGNVFFARVAFQYISSYPQAGAPTDPSIWLWSLFLGSYENSLYFYLFATLATSLCPLIIQNLAVMRFMKTYTELLDNPKEIKQFLTPQPENTKPFFSRWDTKKILYPSLLSALPMATTTWAYPVFKTLWFHVPFTAYMFLNTTLLHFAPTFYIFYHRIFGAGIRAGKAIYQAYQDKSLPEAVYYERLLARQKTQDCDELRGRIAYRIERAKRKLLDEYQKGNGVTFVFDKNHKNPIEQLINYIEGDNSEEDAPEIKNLPKWFENLLYFTGASLVGIFSCMGYYANPFKFMYDRTGSIEGAITFAAAPSLLFAVLLMFFGGEDTINTAKWIHNGRPASMARILHPKLMPTLTGASTTIIGSICALSASQLVLDNFPRDAAYFPYFFYLEWLTITYLSVNAIINSVIDIFELLALYNSAPDSPKRQLAETMTRLNELQRVVGKLDDDALEEALKSLSEDQQTKLLGLKKFTSPTRKSETLAEMIDHEKHLEKSKNNTWDWRSFCCLFRAQPDKPDRDNRVHETYEMVILSRV